MNRTPDRPIGPSWEDLRAGRDDPATLLGLATLPVGKKYSPDQPRDERGRFGETGGEPAVPLGPIPGGQYYADLSPGAQALVNEKLATFGVERQALLAEIESRMTPEALSQGAAWYQDAHNLAYGMERISLGALTPEQAAAAIAVMSPQCSWEVNAETAARMADWFAQGNAESLSPEEATAAFREAWQVNGWGGVGTTTGENRANMVLPDNMTKAFGMMMGPPPDPEDTLATNKIRAFDNNILFPGETKDVTVDVHVSKAFGYASGLDAETAAKLMGSKSTQQEHDYATGRHVDDTRVASVGYTALASAIREVADQYDTDPATVQAAYWISVQDSQPEGWDPPRAAWTIETPYSDYVIGIGGQ